jgi:hypothetical protein
MKYLKHASETLEKHLKILKSIAKNICNIQIKTFANIYIKHMQHPDKHTCNIRMIKQMKHLGQKLAIYATSQSTFATSI